MICEEEANSLMTRFIELKEAAAKNSQLKSELRKHEELCIAKFKYLVTMRTSKYRSCLNYDDLNQDGFEALVRAMNTFKLGRGSFFWWAHKHVDTKIARSANLHTTIRYPMHVAKKIQPKKEWNLPVLMENRTSFIPDQAYEEGLERKSMEYAFSKLTERQKQVLNSVYNLDGNGVRTLQSTCDNLGIDKSTCLKELRCAIKVLKKHTRV